jgi:hypothetical protein
MIIIATLFIFVIVLCMFKLVLSYNINDRLIFSGGYDKDKDP